MTALLHVGTASIKEGTLSIPPILASRANLMETKNTSLNTPEERCWLNASPFWLCLF